MSGSADPETEMIQGWSKESYYISTYLKKALKGVKVKEVSGGFDNKYVGYILFDNGIKICWHEDSEGPGIWLEE